MIKRLKKFIPEEDDNSSEDSEMNQEPSNSNVNTFQKTESVEEEQLVDKKIKLDSKNIEPNKKEYLYF
jgi:hypothetical protein